MNHGFILLFFAIVMEVVATSLLKTTVGFSKWQPTLWVLVSYTISFYLLSLVVKTVPVGVAYAIWSGAGTVLIALVALFWYRQQLDLPAIFGMTLIVVGVLIIQLFSKTQAH